MRTRFTEMVGCEVPLQLAGMGGAIGSPPSEGIGGSVAALPHYAGESVSAATEVVSAAEIVRQLATGAEALLKERVRNLGLA